MCKKTRFQISHAWAPLKVPKHEIFILVDFLDFLTEHTPWGSDLGNNITKII